MSINLEAPCCEEDLGRWLSCGSKALFQDLLAVGLGFPTRVADATDCNVEVTAWGSLLVRPKGTGGDLEKAKRMLFEVLHPAAEAMRKEAFEVEEMAPDQDAKNATQVGGDAQIKGKEHVKGMLLGL